MQTQNPAAFGYDDPTGHPSTYSARKILDLLTSTLNVESVLDVGCGAGIWMRESLSQGIRKVRGVDGPWMRDAEFVVNPDLITLTDLRAGFDLGEDFDLVLCMEVAEHIEDKYSDHVLDCLCRHGDTVCFSAAIPGQGGVHHVNEKYQSYWADKFQSMGYDTYDIIRPKIWGIDSIDFYYAQNALVYSKNEIDNKHQSMPLDIVHPSLFEKRKQVENMSQREIFKSIPKLIFQSVSSRFGKFFG